MIIPQGFKCLLKPDAVSEKTDGGLYKPDQVVDKEKYATKYGTLLMLGSNATRIDVKPDDLPVRVAYAKFSGTDIVDTDGEEYWIINDEDIIAVLKD